MVVDFAATGTGVDRSFWVVRTGGAEDFSRFYDFPVLQRYDLSSRTAEVVLRDEDQSWVPWIIPYTRDGTFYLGSSDLRRPFEYAVP